MRYRRTVCTLHPEPLSLSSTSPRFLLLALYGKRSCRAREGALPPADHGEEESGELARINLNTLPTTET